MITLSATTWRRQIAAHEREAGLRTAAHSARRAAGEPHALEDFVFEYYGLRPGRLRRWHPGLGVRLSATDGAVPHASWRWYRSDGSDTVTVDHEAFMAARGQTVEFVARLLRAVEGRRSFTGCLGLHEWAMVYRQDDHRHPLPLRLGQRGTDEVVERSRLRCSHFDAFRFFTPEAAPMNEVALSRDSQADHDQPGCLHVGMDLLKWCLKLGPMVPGDLTLRAFDLAVRARQLDMRASPYEVSGFGLEPVRIETPEGRAEYVAGQRELAEAGSGLRRALIRLCDQLERPSIHPG